MSGLFFLQDRKRCVGLGLCDGFDRNHAAVALTTLESHHAICESEEGVILTHTNILAGIVDSAALANDDVASDASLTTPDLNAQSL